MSEEKVPHTRLREMARENGLDPTGTTAEVAKRLRRHLAQQVSKVMPPRAFRRAQAKLEKKGSKGAKARTRITKALDRRYGDTDG